jgi:hypothetical protein
MSVSIEIYPDEPVYTSLQVVTVTDPTDPVALRPAAYGL